MQLSVSQWCQPTQSQFLRIFHMIDLLCLFYKVKVLKLVLMKGGYDFSLQKHWAASCADKPHLKLTSCSVQPTKATRWSMYAFQKNTESPEELSNFNFFAGTISDQISAFFFTGISPKVWE